MMEKKPRRVVVTGMEAITSLGKDKYLMWENMSSGKEGIYPINEFDVSQFPVKVAATIDYREINCPDDDEKWLKNMPKSSFLFNAAAQSAVEESGLLANNTYRIDKRRISIITGIPGNRVIAYDEFIKVYPFRVDREITNFYNSLIFFQKGHYPFGVLLSKKIRALGANIHVDTACASSSHALGEGYRLIKHNLADAVVVGGASSFADAFGLSVYNVLNALSTYETRSSRPFDRTRNGFVMGEGAGVLVLEELDLALRRGANILAEVIGYGTSLNAFRVTDANLDGYARCIENALKDARIKADTVDYISAHGTSTPQNDLLETQAVKKVLGDHAYKIPVSSIKSMIGHTICAAGAISAVACIQMINHSTVLPTINYEEYDPECDLDYVPNEKRENVNIDIALSNSFGFGGQNACLVLKKKFAKINTRIQK